MTSPWDTAWDGCAAADLTCDIATLGLSEALAADLRGQQRPVLIANGTGSAALLQLQHEEAASAFGMLHVTTRTPSGRIATVPFERFLRSLRCSGDADDAYIFQPSGKLPAPLGQRVLAVARGLSLLDSVYAQEATPAIAYLALGGVSAGLALHRHTATAFAAQLHGRKRWVLAPPDCARDDGSCRVSCMQKPGDILLVPRGWWHGTLGLDASIAVVVHVYSRTRRGDLRLPPESPPPMEFSVGGSVAHPEL